MTGYQHLTHLTGCQATNHSYFLSWFGWLQRSLKEDEMHQSHGSKEGSENSKGQSKPSCPPALWEVASLTTNVPWLQLSSLSASGHLPASQKLFLFFAAFLMLYLFHRMDKTASIYLSQSQVPGNSYWFKKISHLVSCYFCAHWMPVSSPRILICKYPERRGRTSFSELSNEFEPVNQSSPVRLGRDTFSVSVQVFHCPKEYHGQVCVNGQLPRINLPIE